MRLHPKPNFYSLNKYDKDILEKEKNYNKKSCMPFFLNQKSNCSLHFVSAKNSYMVGWMI